MYRLEDNIGASIIEFTINKTEFFEEASFMAELAIHYSRGRRRSNLSGVLKSGFNISRYMERLIKKCNKDSFFKTNLPKKEIEKLKLFSIILETQFDGVDNI